VLLLVAQQLRLPNTLSVVADAYEFNDSIHVRCDSGEDEQVPIDSLMLAEMTAVPEIAAAGAAAKSGAGAAAAAAKPGDRVQFWRSSDEDYDIERELIWGEVRAIFRCALWLEPGSQYLPAGTARGRDGLWNEAIPFGNDRIITLAPREE
jgi:hypothetical protein